MSYCVDDDDEMQLYKMFGIVSGRKVQSKCKLSLPSGRNNHCNQLINNLTYLFHTYVLFPKDKM